MNKRTVIERTVKLISLFQSGRKLTCKDVENELGITRRSAQAYIDCLSEVYPIYESGKRKGRFGPDAVEYEVLK